MDCCVVSPLFGISSPCLEPQLKSFQNQVLSGSFGDGKPKVKLNGSKQVESYQFKCSILVINGEIVLALLDCFELLVEGGMVKIKQLNFF